MEDYCISCGMPLKKEDNIAKKIDLGSICEFCIDKNGEIKSCQEVFDAGVMFFTHALPDIEKDLAKSVTRKNMLNQPLWQNSTEECLKGDIATDEQFTKVLEELHKALKKNI